MVENRTDEALKAARLIRICKWIYSKRGLFWSTVFLGLGINILATLLFTTWPWSINLKQTTIGWALQNPWTIGAIGLFVWLLDVIIYLASRLPVGPSERAVKRAYLARLSQDNVLLNLNGVPAGLMARRVKLDEVFIPLKFRPTLPLEEYSLTQREIADLHNQRGQKAQEIDRLVIEAERKWERGFQKYDKVDISWLWERLTNKEPVAVIQGYPGMGKSTLLTRLMLYMARRCLREPDASMPALNPALIPLFVSLKEYADERENNTQDLPLLDYLKVDTVRKCNNPALAAFVEKWLSDCSCLVLLDGLDEISELTTRQAIQKAINKFIADQRHPEKQVATFNHFLITSRVAGYDLVAFPHYPHYFVTELTVEQIEEFLPRWCHASARRDLQDAGDEAIIRLADQTATRLIDTVKTNQGVRELAANPLMLTLLTAMQQSGTELPTYRAELYKVVTKTLLEDRNIAKGIPQLPEAEAIQRLGPLAFKMHDEGNGLTHENEVVAVLKDAINALQEGSGSPDKAEEAARTYLKRISERGGLFVPRTGDYYGFFHRTFEEYFAARHMLKQIEIEGVEKVSEYVDLARHKDDLWREPFLLAVAQKSGEDSTIASNLIRKLFETPQTAGEKKRLHDLLLAATCVIESKQETIDRKLQREIVDQLLQTYERAQRQRDFAVCQQLESVVKRWLLGLFSESYQPTALLVILTAVIDIQHVNLQIATLTMLSMIAQQLINGPAVIFKSLVPPLLALSGLPPIEIFHPDPQVSVSDNLNVADLALTALSFMGGPGPAGQLLLFVRQHFKEQPAQLRLLASNSLASRTLITPTVVPFTQENYKKYKSAIAQWIALRDSYQIEHITERDIDVCLAIHQNLLDCAEESRYPTAKHFISMLQAQADHPDELWQEMWRCYLLSQLSSGRYIHYQEVALLWAMLFPDKQELSVLTGLIWQHYTGNTIALQRNAQRFISSLSRDLSD